MGTRGVLAGALIAALVAACDDGAVAECPAGRVMQDGFCVPKHCAAGERVLNGECAPIECAPGSSLEGETCVADDQIRPTTDASPPSGTYSSPLAVTLTANEPAIVFYTTDGSEPSSESESAPSPLTLVLEADTQVRFFSIDPAGNDEDPKGESYVVDGDAPGDVTGLTAVLDVSARVDLAWELPSDGDVEGVMVVRGRTLPLAFTPMNGVAYDIGDKVAPDVVVVTVGDGTELEDQSPFGQDNAYAVWAFDTAGNWSAAPATAEVDAPVPAEPIQLHVSLDDDTVTITEEPQDFLVTATGTTNPDQSELTLELEVVSKLALPVYNLKAIVDDVSAGDVQTDGTFQSKPTAYFGPNALTAGVALTHSFVLDAIPAGTSAIDLELRLATHRLIVAPGRPFSDSRLSLVDGGGAGFAGAVGKAACGNKYALASGQGGDCGFTSVAFAPDGRYLYAGLRNQPRATRIDLTTLEATASVDLGGTLATPPIGTTQIALSPDAQFLYVVLSTGFHRRSYNQNMGGQGGTPVTVTLVKLNAETLTEVDRLDLLTGIDQTDGAGARGLAPSLSQNGSRIAVVTEDAPFLFWIDTTNVSLLFQHALTTTGPRPRAIATAPDGSYVYIASQDTELVRVSTSTQGEETIVTDYVSGTNRPGSMAFGLDGNLYFARVQRGTAAGLIRVQPGSLNVTNVINNTSISGVAFSSDGDFLFAPDANAGQIRVYNLLTNLETTPIPLPSEFPIPTGHFAAISP